MSSAPQTPKSAFTFLPQGALIQEFNVAGHNIVLSLPTAADYKANHAPYFGQTIGRTTNRIKDAQIANLNGKTYHLAANDGANPNSLHGGAKGWGERDFTGPTPMNRNGREGVQFTYLSPDGEEGYPGTVECRVWYTAWTDTTSSPARTILEAEYEVEFTGTECAETVIGVTNHSYFSLNPSAGSIADTTLTLGTNTHLELTPQQIPTGNIIPHPSCPAEPLTPFTLTAQGPSFDDCFVFPYPPAQDVPIDTRPLPLRMAVRMQHPTTKLALEVWSSEPAFQLYTGEGIDVPALPLQDGKGGKTQALGSRAGIAIEPSRYVDAAGGGREEWRGMCLVKRGGGVWGARNRYVAWREE